MGKTIMRGAYAPYKPKKFVIYADGFKEYEFEKRADALDKLNECVADEQKYQYKRNWYMREE